MWLLGGSVGVTSEAVGFAAADAGELALQWLESVGSALLLVDQDLHVHWANPLARKWLTAKEPLAQVGKQLHIGRSQQPLRTLLRKADDEFEGICVPIDGRGAHLIVSARRITASKERPFYGLIARRSDKLETRLLGVREAFRLTSAEARVLHLLIQGRTAQTAAEHLRISVETVRTHIRSLYTKLEVSSREAMFLRLRPFMTST